MERGGLRDGETEGWSKTALNAGTRTNVAIDGSLSTDRCVESVVEHRARAPFQTSRNARKTGIAVFTSSRCLHAFLRARRTSFSSAERPSLSNASRLNEASQGAASRDWVGRCGTARQPGPNLSSGCIASKSDCRNRLFSNGTARALRRRITSRMRVTVTHIRGHRERGRGSGSPECTLVPERKGTVQ